MNFDQALVETTQALLMMKTVLTVKAKIHQEIEGDGLVGPITVTFYIGGSAARLLAAIDKFDQLIRQRLPGCNVKWSSE